MRARLSSRAARPVRTCGASQAAQPGSVEGFNYSKDLVAAGEAGLVWDEEKFVAFTADPRGFLREETGNSKAKSKMSFRLKKGGEDIYAFLASHGPVAEEAAAAEETTTAPSE